VATRLTTICCSALALSMLLPCRSLAQGRPVKQTHAADDRTPLAFFPIETMWTLALNNSLTATPAYDSFRAFFPLEGDRLAAYELATGNRLWLIDLHTTFEPATGDDFVFVIKTGSLAALRASDGSVAWELPLSETAAVPPVWDNGWLLVSTTSGDVLALRGSDGTMVWRRNLGTPAHAHPVFAGDRVYVPGTDGRVIALRVDTGETVWERRLGGAANDIAVNRERIYVGSHDRYFYCLNEHDGRVDWRWATGGPVIGVPVLDNRTVYFVSLDNVVRGLNRSSGVQRWKTPLSLRPATGPLLVEDAVIVSGPTPTLRAFKAADGKPAGEFALPGELAAPPHVFVPKTRAFPVLLAIARDLVNGITVVALTRSFEPKVEALTGLPNPVPVSPTPSEPPGPADSAPSASSGSPPPR
jgi:outer membrane protein assembly factor BamB